jgi:hypothetical protein
LAGAVHAISLLEFIRDQHDGERLGRFASSLLREIQDDRETLQELADQVGVGSSEAKELTAWVSEKFSRLKLRRGKQNGFGTFEALEFLELGIHGKWALWRALGAVADTDSRLRGLNYEHLAERAEAQHSLVEERRLEIAHKVLRPTRH